MKKFIAAIMSVLFLCFSLPVNAEERVAISTPEPPDYRQGIIDDGRNIKAINLPSQVIDNNLSTGYVMLGYYDWYVEFLYPTDISAMFLDMIDSGRGTLTITFESGYTTSITFDGTQSGYHDLGFYGVVKIGLKRTGVEKLTMREVEFFGTYYVGVPQDVMNLTKTEGDGEVTLKYTIPEGLKVNIYVDGQKVVEEVTVSTYRLSNLENGRTYRITVKTVDPHGVESAGVTIEATPMEESREVQNLKVTAKHDRVNLSWTNPKRNDFHHVKIYRKTLQKLQNQALKIIPVARAAEGYDPLFETNGTYFNDLTVQPETSYEYKLTTEDTNGNESAGVTVQVTTPPIPPPSTGGTTIIRHENGDVTVRWTPQPGQMIIEIDGVEYRRVDAQLGEYTIPAADIPVDANGKPAPIRLIPVAPNGATGPPLVINPGGWLLALPFGARELLQAGLDLVMVLGPIILLSLVLWYVRPIMRLLKMAASGRERT